MRYFPSHLRIAFQQRQRFVQKVGDILFRKFVGFFARIIQKLGDDLVQALRFPADDADQMLFVLLQRHQAAQFLHGAGHGRQRLADFVRDGRGEAPERRHAFLGGHFLLQALQVREVLKIENVAGGAALSGAQRGNRYADEALLAVGSHEIHFAALRQLAVLGHIARKPERRATHPASAFPRTARNWLPVISSPVRFSSRMRPSRSVVSRPPRME